MKSQSTDEPVVGPIEQGSSTALETATAGPAIMPQSARPRFDRRVRWEWNYGLLVKASIVLALVGGLFAATYLWQSQRLAQGLLDRAAAAEQEGDTTSQLKWLARYVRLVPRDLPALIKLALLEDSMAVTMRDADNARRRLSVALGATGEGASYADERQLLREKLIQRLLQLPRWAAEAERQVLALDPPPGDPRASKWLALALVMQRKATPFVGEDPDTMDPETGHWKKFVAQPTGLSLYQAWKANPDDIDLATQLLYSSMAEPTMFDAVGKPADPAVLSGYAEEAVERLTSQVDDGQAQLAVATHLARSDQEASMRVLEAALPGALERLAADYSRRDSDKTTGADGLPPSLAEPAPLSPAAERSYQPYWDWTLSLETARQLAGAGETDRSQEIYSQLVKWDSPRLPQPQRESTYMKYGQLLWKLDDTASAIEVWEAGAQSVVGSIELTNALAEAHLRENHIKQAQTWIDELKRLAEQQLRLLESFTSDQITPSERLATRERLQLALWNGVLLEGQLAMRAGDISAAARLAEQAFTSPISVGDPQRVQAGRLLAACYYQQQLWDMAGQVLDRCIGMQPNDPELRRTAAEAWKNAGSAERATQQLATLDDGSFEAALEIARLTAFREDAKPSGRADLAAVREAVGEARRRYDAAPAARQAPLNLWQLEILELGYAAQNAEDIPVSAEERLTSLQEIAGRYPQALQLQLLAATRLAAGGRTAAAQDIIQRLEDVARGTGAASDRANVAIAKANMHLANSAPAEALSELEAAMRAVPEERLRLATTAASLALQARLPEEAYRILRLVPEEQLKADSLMTLADISNALATRKPEQLSSIREDMKRWIARLRAMEGEQGTYWRYLEAQQLLADAVNATNRRQLLDQATLRFNEIDVRRPRWGQAAALGGQIESLKGMSSEAIRLYRRAIRDGDKEAKTIISLVRELKLVGREGEAQQELQRLSGRSEAIMPVSAMTVALAQDSGDYQEALQVARDLTRQQDREIVSWLLLADALMKAAADAKNSAATDAPGEAQAWMDEAWAALETAQQLAGGKSAKVWNNRIRFRLIAEGTAGAEQELQAFEKSPTAADERLLTAAQWYMQLKQYGKTQERIDQYLASNPRRAEPYLILAEMHNRQGDTAASLTALRGAQAAEPANQPIRDRLALALAFSPSNDPEQHAARLEEIDTLLASTDKTSSDRSRLVKAIIDLSSDSHRTGSQRADSRQRVNRAIVTLREIARVPSLEGNDAKRAMASHFASRWMAATDEMSPDESNRLLQEASRLYDELGRASPASPMDPARHVDLLLKASVVDRQAGNEDLVSQRLEKAEQVLEVLESMTDSSMISLQLRIRLALAHDEAADVQAIAQQWVADASEMDATSISRLAEIAGSTLADMGLAGDSLLWLEQVYEQDSSKLPLYVIAVAKAGRFERALEICVQEYRKSPSVAAAALISEVAILRGNVALPADAEEVLRAALAEFEDSAMLLETVATLRLVQERFPEAVGLFQQVEKVSPERIRTLNNLAMALSEIPMGKNEALKKIDRAIELQGRVPELLDTRGIVLLRLGRLDEAKQVLGEAADRADDDRFKLHLAQVAMAQKDLASAKAIWLRIDHTKITKLDLSTEEREFLRQLQNRLQAEL